MGKSESIMHVQMQDLHLDYDGYKRGQVLLRFNLRISFCATRKMPRLNEENRNRAIGRLEAGESQSSVARRLNVRQSTISRLWHRYTQHNSTRDCPRSGRPRVTTPAQDRYIFCCIDMMEGYVFRDVEMRDMLDSAFVKSTDTVVEV